ncbi:hypothetical protein Hanom_Chr01g00060951 [Helianthus anomalus]
MQLSYSGSSSNRSGMDLSNNNPSFLKLIEDDDPIFLIVDGNNISVVRLKRTSLGPVLGDGFTKVVRCGGTKNDYLLFGFWTIIILCFCL